MALRAPVGAGASGITYVAFNQDASCICVGTAEGVGVFSLETHKLCYRLPIGAVRWGSSRQCWAQRMRTLGA
jgi:hypothetical protein